MQAFLLFFIAIIIYSNTANHEYVYDDLIVIQNNSEVQKGIAGIPDLLTKDSFYGYNHGQSDLTGGRYRPLSLITFAIEHEIFGDNAPPEHIMNVLLYALCCVILLFTLYKIFPAIPSLVIFSGAFLFSLHPAHTEVVANIKSRDEILCLLFILFTFFFWMELLKEKKVLSLILALASFILALLSKEHAIFLLIWLPLAWWLNNKSSLKKILISLVPFIVVGAIYLFIRSSFVGTVGDRTSTDVMNNPYYLATATEKYATIFSVLLIYFLKSFYPYQLSYDYTFSAIPYQNFSSPFVICGLILILALSIWTIFSIVKKQNHSLLVLIWLLPIILVSNLFFNVGAPLADRFLFLPSIGICVVMVGALKMIFKTIKEEWIRNQIVFLLVIAIGFFYGIKTYSRNSDWKSNSKLFAVDEPKVPNSVKATLNYGSILMEESEKETNPEIKKEKLNHALQLFKKGISIYPTADLLNHLGAYYSIKKQLDSSEYYYRKSLEIKNDFAMAKTNLIGILQEKGVKLHAEKKEDSAMLVFRKQLELDSTFADAYNNVGTVYFSLLKFDSSKHYFIHTLTLDPAHISAKLNLANTYLSIGNNYFLKNNFDSAIANYYHATLFKPDYTEAFANTGVIYMQQKKYQLAKSCFEKALSINPYHDFSKARLAECEKFISN